MADRKISDLTALTTPATGDLLPIVDISEATAADKNKSITVGELFKGVPDGTAAAPGLAFESDDGNGIYKPGADQVAISTNGTGRLFVASDGKIGIGSANPQDALHIAVPSAVLRLEDTDTNHISTIQSTAAALVLSADATNTVASSYLGLSVDGNERLRITSDGKLGLGISSPATDLHLSNTTGPVFRIGASGGVGNAASTGRIEFYGGSTAGNGPGIKAVIDTEATTGTARDFDLLFKTATNVGSGEPLERLRIAANGNVGIGATPSASLHIETATVETEIRLTTTGGNIKLRGSNDDLIVNADQHLFNNEDNTSEYARIDGSGRLLVGTSSARSNVVDGDGGNTLTPQFQFETANNDAAKGLSVIYGRNNTNGAEIVLGKHRAATVGGNTIVSSGDQLGSLTFSGSDGTNFRPAATVAAFVDNTPGASDMPGRLVFSTTADGASSPTERMRIKSDGKIVMASDASMTSEGGAFLTVRHTSNATLASKRTGTSGENHHIFLNANGQVGSISTNGSATTYATSSDYRLKENVVPLTGAADRINQLQVRRFNFIADPDTTVDGFIAHEAQAVVPEAVTGTQDEVDDDGNPVYQGIDQSKLVPLLTAALQEALAKIETLEQRLNDAGIA